MSDPYDMVVVGGGSAGYAGAATAAKLGLRVAVVEGGDEIGGLCILRGCMPSKTLIESASRMDALRRAGEFGIRTGEFSVNGRDIQARKERLVGEFAQYRREQLERGAFEFIRGRASFVDSNTIAIEWPEQETRQIRARSFLLATGSVLQRIPIEGLDEIGFRDSDAVLAWSEVPESVCILGAGATGLEFAHYFAGLGVQVTILQRGPQLLKEMDADAANALSGALSRRGIRIHFKARLTRVERANGLKAVLFEHDGETKRLEVSEIIYALGRIPRVTGLGLDRAGVAVENGRLKTNHHQQTNVSHIFAAGDVAGPFEIVHIAIQQGEVAARNAARMIREDSAELEAIDYRLKLFAVFTEPQVAAVGATEKELRHAMIPHLVATYPFADHGKALVRGEPEGFVKLIAHAETLEIIGAAVVGAEAAELIHEIVVAMHFRATAGDLAMIPHYHPTLSEIWTYPAEELAARGAGNAANR